MHIYRKNSAEIVPGIGLCLYLTSSEQNNNSCVSEFCYRHICCVFVVVVVVVYIMIEQNS